VARLREIGARSTSSSLQDANQPPVRPGARPRRSTGRRVASQAPSTRRSTRPTMTARSLNTAGPWTIETRHRQTANHPAGDETPELARAGRHRLVLACRWHRRTPTRVGLPVAIVDMCRVPSPSAVNGADVEPLSRPRRRRQTLPSRYYEEPTRNRHRSHHPCAGLVGRRPAV